MSRPCPVGVCHPTSIRPQQPSGDAAQQTMCADAKFTQPRAPSCFCRISRYFHCTGRDRSRPAKLLHVEPDLPGSIAIFAHEAARVLSALRSPAIRSKETGAMTTVFARPKLQVFGVSTPFVVRKISLSDLGDALRLGWEDFKAIPTHAIVLCVIYPVLGLVLFRLVIGYSVLPLLFPLAAGFTLIGPFAGLGLYELSRRRERGEEAAIWDAMQVLRAPSSGAILELAVLLPVLFGAWT